jgi:hypothetical protein
MDKATLLSTIKTEHTKLESILAVLPPSLMEVDTPGQYWTIKETIVHITSWEQVLLADYSRLKQGETIHELDGDDEINESNAATRKNAASKSADEALAEFNKSFRQIVVWLENLPEDDLDWPFAYGMTLGEFICEDTWKHYAEHLPLLSSRAKTI